MGVDAQPVPASAAQGGTVNCNRRGVVRISGRFSPARMAAHTILAADDEPASLGAIARQQHGGAVSLHSRRGVGRRFTGALPQRFADVEAGKIR